MSAHETPLSTGEAQLGNLGRRKWVVGSIAMLGLLAVDSVFATHPERAEEVRFDEWLHLFCADFVGNAASLARLGSIYLASHPEECDRNQLARLLSIDKMTSVGLSLRDSIKRDWGAHNVIVVSGWVLARTEARVCAALHLMSDPTI